MQLTLPVMSYTDVTPEEERLPEHTLVMILAKT